MHLDTQVEQLRILSEFKFWKNFIQNYLGKKKNYSWLLNKAEVDLHITYSQPSIPTVPPHPWIQPTADYVAL